MNKVILITTFFLYLFSPKFIFFPIDPSFLIAFGSTLLLFYSKNVQTVFIKVRWCVLFLLTAGIIWSTTEFFLANTITTSSYGMLLIRIVFEVIIPCCCFVVYLNKQQVDLIKILSYFILFQSLICIMMLYSPIQDLVFDKIIFVDDYTKKFISVRNFGIGRNYLSWFASCCSFICIFLFIDFVWEKKILSFVSFLCGNIILILNTRTSLLIELIGLLLVCLYSVTFGFSFVKKIIYKKVFFQTLFLIVLLLLLFLVLTQVHYEFFTQIASWIESGYTAIVNFLTGNSQNDTFTDLNVWYIPSTTEEFLFGTGLFISDVTGQSSDIGYVRLLSYGGIILSCLIYIYFIICIINALKNTDKLYKKIFIIYVFFSMFLLQYKGDVFSLNEVIRLLFFLFIFSLYKRSKKHV